MNISKIDIKMHMRRWLYLGGFQSKTIKCSVLKKSGTKNTFLFYLAVYSVYASVFWILGKRFCLCVSRFVSWVFFCLDVKGCDAPLE